MNVDFLPKNFPPFQVHHAKKPPRFYPDGFQRNVIDFYFIFSDCRLRKALYLQFSYFIWPLGRRVEVHILYLGSSISKLPLKNTAVYAGDGIPDIIGHIADLLLLERIGRNANRAGNG